MDTGFQLPKAWWAPLSILELDAPGWNRPTPWRAKKEDNKPLFGRENEAPKIEEGVPS